MSCRGDILKVGDKFSRTSYGTVRGVSGNSIEIENEAGHAWSIGRNIVEDEFFIADQHTTVEKKTKTELAEIFLANPRIIMKLSFNKQVKVADVVEEVSELYANKGGKIISEAEFKKRVKSIVTNALEGEERIIIGRHQGSFNELGRVHFVDMEQVQDRTKEYDTRMRQVDPRSINWIIVNNVKYELK